MSAQRQQPKAGATATFKIHFRDGDKGRRRLRSGARPAPPCVELGRIPRISRLVALAIHFDDLIREGVVRDYGDLARLGGVSRARVSQIMDLLNLAPEVQEDILLLSRVEGQEPITERRLRPIIAELDWCRQRQLWQSCLDLVTIDHIIRASVPQEVVSDGQETFQENTPTSTILPEETR